MSNLTEDIQRIARCNAQFRTDRLAPYGLKGCHASYLREICANPGLSQDKLAQRICINKSNVARQAAALEEGGFILRRSSPSDKRVIELFPTEKTLALMPEVNAVLECSETYLTEGMSPEEFETVCRVLERMKQKADAINGGG